METDKKPIFDPADDMMWAKAGRLHANWLRDIAPTYGLDPYKLVLGTVLGSITGDDLNCFGSQAAGFFNVSMSYLGKRHLWERMDFEITTPETPEVIRERLLLVRPILFSFEWGNDRTFLATRNCWMRYVSNFTQRQIALHPYMRDATRYDIANSSLLSDPWSQYFYGSPLVP